MSNAINSIHPVPQSSSLLSGGPAPLMPSASPHEVLDLRSSFQVVAFAHAEVVYRAGDSASRIFILRSGRVRLHRATEDSSQPAGSGSLLSLLKAGDLFGDLLRPAGSVMNESAISVGESEAWSLESSELPALLDARPTLAIELLQALNERAHQLQKRVNALTFKEVPARLAEAILHLSETHGERCPHGSELDLRGVTQQDLADLVGASRSFVSTLINEMKRDGMLSNVGRTLCIRNRQMLAVLAARDRI